MDMTVRTDNGRSQQTKPANVAADVEKDIAGAEVLAHQASLDGFITVEKAAARHIAIRKVQPN
jgi:hypothetical protein